MSTDTLVSSPVPGTSEALTAGYSARVARTRADDMRTELERRCDRPLPEGGRERGWAISNRSRYLAETTAAERTAEQAGARYALLLAAVADIAPETAVKVNASIWRTER